ncbi:hypothetical protein M378DRAFT_172095 [Amanita muscaria Koide BX008]|uniref:Uncharacterized protein n=1 Tax=Amanita muscaria (strain Koide BX008) TaxID=946122 RepID=A0A0C2WLR5_AMAMK|nr:hypothetical protein M378DRAFT_172095 [Amanita muscaria Koide BX008]
MGAVLCYPSWGCTGARFYAQLFALVIICSFHPVIFRRTGVFWKSKAHATQTHQENGNIRSSHSRHFGKWSERSERSALESGRTTYLRSLKTLREWFNLFESRPSALKAPLKAPLLL